MLHLLTLYDNSHIAPVFEYVPAGVLCLVQKAMHHALMYSAIQFSRAVILCMSGYSRRAYVQFSLLLLYVS